jgi:hypothetical protein
MVGVPKIELILAHHVVVLKEEVHVFGAELSGHVEIEIPFNEFLFPVFQSGSQLFEWMNLIPRMASSWRFLITLTGVGEQILTNLEKVLRMI